MTAIVALDHLSPDTLITVPAEAVGVEGSSVYLIEGEKLTLYQLLCALLLSSANDAAVAIALSVSDSVDDFSQLMNEKARSMGLTDTNFVNPHGLYHEEHYTTARELALIAREALGYKEIAEIVKMKKTTVPYDGVADQRLLVNHNRLLSSYEGALGMKTGYTKKTGRTLVSAAEKEGLTLIAVTLNAPDDWRDHRAMLDYGFNSYKKVTLYETGEFCYELPLSNGERETVRLTNTEPLCVTVRKSEESYKITVEGCGHFLLAPVKKGEPFGAVLVEYGETVASASLEIAESVKGKTKPKISILERIKNFFSLD